jgi:hypothetical protein
LLKIAINKIIIKFAIKKDNDKLGVETNKKKIEKRKRKRLLSHIEGSLYPAPSRKKALMPTIPSKS